MKLKMNTVAKIRLVTRWRLLFAFIIACSSVVLVYANSEYAGVPYFGEGNPMFFAQSIEHEHHDYGSVGVQGYDDYDSLDIIAYEVGFTSPSNEEMKPTEWVKYTLYISHVMIDTEADDNLPFDDQPSPNPHPHVYASTNCTGNQVGRLDFTLDGYEDKSAFIEFTTDGRNDYDQVTASHTDSSFSFHENSGFKAGDEVVLKVTNTGDCSIFLDWFQISAPSPSGTHTGF